MSYVFKEFIIDACKNNFEEIVLKNIPLIDVRAEIEYYKGSFLNSTNLELINNKEREVIGTTYKKKGQDEAVQLGFELVSSKIKEKRVDAWENFINKNPSSMLYCFRGGMRSKISQEWIYERTNKIIPRIEGGYKNFRRYLIESLKPQSINSEIIVLGGNTGSNKTKLLNKINFSIDLEALANHRGSSFGNHVSKQPSQINFENNLAYSIIKHNNNYYKYMLLEDEGKHIGRCYMPKELALFIKNSNFVILEIPIEDRINNILEEYVINFQKEFKLHHNELYLEKWSETILFSINRIKKRLGGLRHSQLIKLFQDSYDEQIKNANFSAHKNWIRFLLKEYYDPMYNYQISKIDKVLFKGSKIEVEDFFKQI